MTGFDRTQRSAAPERMDHEHLDRADLARCLADLERLSRLTLGHRPTLRWLDRVTRGIPRDRELTVLDIACGGGDMLRAARRWAGRRGRRVRLRGVDLNPDIIAIARSESGPDIDYQVGDALAITEGADLIVNALFLHHLDNEQAATLLARMADHARLGWFVSDLHRHVLSYQALRLVTSTLRLHRFVRSDGPISVARGWQRSELSALVGAAGLDPAQVSLRWALPFRWALSGGRASPR